MLVSLGSLFCHVALSNEIELFNMVKKKEFSFACGDISTSEPVLCSSAVEMMMKATLATSSIILLYISRTN